MKKGIPSMPAVQLSAHSHRWGRRRLRAAMQACTQEWRENRIATAGAPTKVHQAAYVSMEDAYSKHHIHSTMALVVCTASETRLRPADIAVR